MPFTLVHSHVLHYLISNGSPRKLCCTRSKFPNRGRTVVRRNFWEGVKFYESVKRVGGHFVNVWGAGRSEQVSGRSRDQGLGKDLEIETDQLHALPVQRLLQPPSDKGFISRGNIFFLKYSVYICDMLCLLPFSVLPFLPSFEQCQRAVHTLLHVKNF